MNRNTNRVQQSRDDLKRQLAEQRSLLRHFGERYDAGEVVFGKPMANTLRLLLHSGRGRTRALLDQLGMRSGRFLSSVPPLYPGNLLSDSPLVMIQLGDAGARYLPLCAAGASPVLPRWIPFVDWWSEPVLRDRADRRFSRMDLVKSVADTDGGSHVDADLEAPYYELSRQNSLGWHYRAAGQDFPMTGPEMACIRQIAYEVLLTLESRDGAQAES